MDNAYVDKLAKHNLLPKEKELELARIRESGTPEESKRALDQLILHNVKLAITIALRRRNPKVDLDDIFGAALLGLVTAATRFRAEFDCKFGTYASWYINLEIDHTIQGASVIRIPKDKWPDVAEFAVFLFKFRQDNYRNPTDSEIMESLKLNDVQFGLLIKAYAAVQTSQYSSSNLEPKYESNVLNELCDKEMAEVTHGILNGCGLSERELDILCKYYGLCGESQLTLAEIGVIYGLTHQRIRQIGLTTQKKIILFLKKNIVVSAQLATMLSLPSLDRELAADSESQNELQSCY